MRLTGGRLRGRVLSAHAFAHVRPTTDRVRETIFNILHNHAAFDGAHVLDLFAGSGVLGFEAVSRGAVACVSVEQHRRTAGTIEETARGFGLGDVVSVVRQDVLRFLAAPGGHRFRFVFCDPPYALMAGNRVFSLLAHNGWCEPGGLLIAEHDTRETILVQSGWTKVAERAFGETTVDFFQYSAEML